MNILKFDLNNLIGIVGIAIAVIAAYLSHRKPKVILKDISRIKIINRSEDVKEDIKLIIGDSEVTDDVELVIAKIVNVGNRSITQKDYVQDLRLEVGPKAEILNSSIKEGHPTHLEVNVKTQDDHKSAILSHAHLNSGDSITLKLYITGYDTLELKGHIDGQSDFKRPKGDRYLAAFFALLGLVLLAIGMAYATRTFYRQVFYSEKITGPEYILTSLGFFSIVIGFFMFKEIRETIKDLVKVIKDQAR